MAFLLLLLKIVITISPLFHCIITISHYYNYMIYAIHYVKRIPFFLNLNVNFKWIILNLIYVTQCTRLMHDIDAVKFNVADEIFLAVDFYYRWNKNNCIFGN